MLSWEERWNHTSKHMKKSSLTLCIICLLWSLYHWLFLQLNEVMKIADSFAYLQMSHFFWELSSQGLWNGWFWFIYSLPIALVNIIIHNDFLAAQIVNLILLNISALLVWKIARSIFEKGDLYSYLVVILFFLSPTLLHFNIHILTENIYIPLFLGTFLLLQKFIQSPSNSGTIFIACMIGLMYLTRAEAFIYLASVGIISLIMLYQKRMNIGQFFGYAGVFFISFFIFISPYLIYLNGLTWEWGLTNKGASNLRQAELRWQEQMDDAGFEQAVAELTSDNTSLISGFAGGMPYDKPSIEGSLWDYISKDPSAFVSRVLTNQKKIYTQNFPEIILGKSPSLYYSDDKRFSNIFFLLYCLIPFIVLLFGIYKIFQKERDFFIISLAFFIPASIFFTLFFTLNRYFLIFLPLILIVFVYWVQNIKISPFVQVSDRKWEGLIKIFFIWNFISILLLSTSVYYNIESPKDEYYSLKKTAGQWLKENLENTENLKIIERFPIVTYYSGSKTRYITPYTDTIADIYEYGSYHDIDILVVDTMDFKTYRPALTQYLDIIPKDFIKLQEFSNSQQQKVILYRLKK